MNAFLRSPALVNPNPSEHLVVFSSNQEMLEEAVGLFLAEGFRRGGSSILIATRDRVEDYRRSLGAHGIDVTEVERAGRLESADAAEWVARIKQSAPLSDDQADELVSGVLSPHDRSGRPLRMYGEAVGMLVDRDLADAAIRLEAAWHRQMASRPHAAAMCGYASPSFTRKQTRKHLSGIRALHSRTLVL